MDVGSLYIATGRNSAFAHHSIRTSLLSPDQLAAVLAEKHTKEEWSFLFHTWKSQVVLPLAEMSDPVGRDIVSVMKPPKRVRLEATANTPARLNFNSFSEAAVIDDAVDNLTEEEPDLVLLSSTSSDDKPQEE